MIHYIWKSQKYDLPLVADLKIGELIKRIEEARGILSQNDQYLIYYRGIPLELNKTVKASGVCDDDTLTVVTRFEMQGNPVLSVQKLTSGTISNFADLNRLRTHILEKKDLVCKITGGETGTGFMIGSYLIMTNEHVLTGKQYSNGKAEFFYEIGETKIEVDICPNPVCYSSSPGGLASVTANALDYAILRLNPRSIVEYDKLNKLKQLEEKASAFFNEAWERYQKNTRIEAELKNEFSFTTFKELADCQKKRRQRANIIQHPKGREKEVAWRETKVYNFDPLELHYISFTDEGSSGALVMNDEGQWIGLHYAECAKIEQKLFEYRLQLFGEIGVTFDEGFYKNKWSEQITIIQNPLSPPTQPTAIWFRNGLPAERFKLWVLINEYITREEKALFDQGKPTTLPHFISEFLMRVDKNKAYSITQLEEHLDCNTAVDVEQIFRDLQVEDDKKLKLVFKAQKEAKEEWGQVQTLPEKGWYRKINENLLPISLVVGSIAVGILIGWKKDSLRQLARRLRIL